MDNSFGLWSETAEDYPRFEKGAVWHRLHWQPCLFLAGRTQEEAYDLVKKYHTNIELPKIDTIPGYEPLDNNIE